MKNKVLIFGCLLTATLGLQAMEEGSTLFKLENFNDSNKKLRDEKKVLRFKLISYEQH